VFIGHFALGFAAKRVAPRVNLAALFAAAILADVLWPIFLLLGLEQVRIDPGNTAFTPLDFVSYPWSHSLLMLAVWGALFGWMFRSPDRPIRMWVVAALVVSHWVLDWITHRPDMPLYPGGPRFGLGLWNSVPGTIAVEIAMFLAGVWIYFRCTRARDGIGRWAIYGLVALLAVAYVSDIGGPPPPTPRAIAIVAIIATAIVTLLTWWADRHRESTCLTH
jgi:hypothetical protein